MRRSNVDDIDIGIGHELGVGTIGGGGAGAVDALDEVGGAVGGGGRCDGDDVMGDVGYVAD